MGNALMSSSLCDQDLKKAFKFAVSKWKTENKCDIKTNLLFESCISCSDNNIVRDLKAINCTFPNNVFSQLPQNVIQNGALINSFENQDGAAIFNDCDTNNRVKNTVDIFSDKTDDVVKTADNRMCQTINCSSRFSCDFEAEVSESQSDLVLGQFKRDSLSQQYSPDSGIIEKSGLSGIEWMTHPGYVCQGNEKTAGCGGLGPDSFAKSTKRLLEFNCLMKLKQQEFYKNMGCVLVTT